ncbi:MAG: hypothetical protein K9H25_11190 [Rhodospirillum sp.]|nr:hypothetical protein [Rhodospirillum sp.]MCF8489501.1 hypothetical protein [Rhodospirillum sp.]
MRVAVDVNGSPSFVCSPSDEDGLEKFLKLAFSGLKPLPSVRTRPANRQEEQKFITELVKHLENGGTIDALFAVAL